MTDSRTEFRWSCLPFAALSPARLYRMLALRSAVFVVEQRCAYLDPDGVDEVGWMLLAETPDDAVVATARLLGPGVRFAEPSIGRVCTAMDWRGTGLGRALMVTAIAEASARYAGQPVRISAQAHLERFYASLGFVVDSAPYDEDGIPHLEMLRPAGPEGAASGGA